MWQILRNFQILLERFFQRFKRFFQNQRFKRFFSAKLNVLNNLAVHTIIVTMIAYYEL